MNSLGDSFSWPFRDPGWLGKIVLQGLILIIPIVGAIAMLGWMMRSLDNLRAGRFELAPAGFHLSRGIALFGAEVVYYLAIYVPFGILLALGAIASQQSGALAGLLTALAQLEQTVAGLLFAFIFPALVVRTYEAGFAGGMDIGRVWRLASSNVGNSVLAALVMIAAGIISSLGLILCGVGVLFTTADGGAVIAGATEWYRRTQQVPQAAPQV